MTAALASWPSNPSIARTSKADGVLAPALACKKIVHAGIDCRLRIQCETWIHQTSRGERNRRKAGKLKHQLELRGGSLIGLARTRELAQQRIDSWRDQGRENRYRLRRR